MLGRSVTLMIGTKLVVQFMGFASLFVVARYMGPEPLGMIGFATGFVGLFSMISDLGFQVAHRKKVSQGDDLGLSIGTFLTIKLVLLLSMVVLIFSSIFFLHENVFNNFPDSIYTVFLIMLSVFIIRQLIVVITITFEAKEQFVKASIPNLFSKFVGTILRIIIALSGLGVIYLAFTQFIGALLCLLISIFYFRNYPISKPTRNSITEYTKFTAPLFLMIMMANFVSHLDKFMIGLFTSAEELGIYSANYRVVYVIMLLPQTLESVIFPTISRKQSEGKLKEINHLINKTIKFLMLILAPPIIFMIVFPELIINILLGPKFITGAIFMQIFALHLYFSSLSRPLTTQIIAMNEPKTSAKIGFWMFSANIILNLIFIPDSLFGFKMLNLGAEGAAFATLLSTLVMCFLSLYYSYNLFGTGLDWSNIIKNTISFIITFQCLSLVENYFKIEILFTPLIIILCLAFYYSFLLIMKDLEIKDLKNLTESVNPYKMKDYLKSELNGEK